MASPSKKSLKIGIDFGGVLSIHDHAKQEAPEAGAQGQHKSTAIDMPDGIDVLRQLKADGHRLYLISFAGQTRAKETKKALLESFPDVFDGMYFPKSKSFKTNICQNLGCDIMIDDIVDLLSDISKCEPRMRCLWFQGDPAFPEEEKKDPQNTHIHPIGSWKAVLSFIEGLDMSTLPEIKPNPSHDLSKKIYQI
jgi:hypothetical protein